MTGNVVISVVDAVTNVVLSKEKKKARVLRGISWYH
jgi:hypothetical protein